MSLEILHKETLRGINNNKINVKYFIVAFIICFVLMLFFCGYIYFKTLGLMQVVNQNGVALPTRLERKEMLVKETIKQSIATTTHYVNTINRITFKEYQARASFLVSNTDLQEIYKTYDKNKYFSKATKRGVEYKNELLEIIKIDTSIEPYKVAFKSRTRGYDGVNIIDEFYILTEADVSPTTPKFEENPNGWFFSNYNQKYFKDEN